MSGAGFAGAGAERMTSALATIRETPGLDEYLEELEERLEETVASHEGLVAAVSRDALSAGGKRLRPLLVFFATPPGSPPSVAAGVAVELVHMATLVHDDLIDGAEFRRGRASAWSAYGPCRRARPATSSSPARSRSWRRRATHGPSRSSPTPRSAWPAARRCSGARRTIRTRRSTRISRAAA